MEDYTPYAALEPYLRQALPAHARRLVGVAGFTEQDLPDLTQSLLVLIWPRLTHFNPARAQWSTYVTRQLEYAAAHLIRRQCALIRQPLPSIDADDPETLPLHAVHLTGIDGHRLTVSGETATDQADLRMTLATLLDHLTPLQREICTHLLAGHPVQTIARMLGVHRVTVYRQLEHIRAACRLFGLRATATDATHCAIDADVRDDKPRDNA
ncbi:MAG: sigma-70 family RNA polymerase sigma factor [Armatimonadota bacterium]